MFLLAKQIKKVYLYKKEKDLYIIRFRKIDLVDIANDIKTNKEILNFKNAYNTYTRLRLDLINIK